MADFPIRILWNTAPWFDVGQTWRGYSLASRPNSPGNFPTSGDGLNLGGTTEDLGFLQDSLRDPRVGHILSWADAHTTDLGSFSGTYQDRGVIPSNQDFYQVRVDHGHGVEADCMYINGFENANIRIYHASGGPWQELTIDSPWNNQLRQTDHWSRNISQKFVLFPKTISRYWRVDFARVSGLPFYGKISSIIGGVHYEFDANSDGAGGADYHGTGQSVGGIFTAQNRADPAFRSATFNFPFGTDADLGQFGAMMYRKVHGDPVIVQYYDQKTQDRYTIYGVVATGGRERVRTIDSQHEIRFTVNELTTNRTRATDYYLD